MSGAAGRSNVSFKLGRYDVLAPLPGRVTDTTYLCRQAGQWGFERLFMLKLIPAESQEATEALLREARIGSFLNHAHVGRVIDVGSSSGRPFLVLDYVEGTTLASLLSGTPSPPAAVVISILLEALQGLQAVHDMVDATGTPLGIVHCDLSSQCIAVGVDGIARINDFGNARLAGEAGNGPHTAAQPGFRSPEQVRGAPVDPRTDVFAMGVILWNALTGQTLSIDPGHGQTALGDDLESPGARGVAAVLDEVCRKALERSPASRYQSADEMRLALHQLASREGLIASNAEIGTWVSRIAGDELADRRRVLAESADADRADDPASLDLPSLAPAPDVSAAPPRSRALLAILAATLVTAASVLAVQGHVNASTSGMPASISNLFRSSP
jgi:serine/threonine protein kinase